MDKRLIGLALVGLLAAIVARNTLVQPKFNNTAEFLRSQKFQYGLPKLFSIFLPTLATDPQSLILPPGELWPAPESWYDLTPSPLMRFFTWILAKTPRLAQQYEPDLFQYRILQAGLGYCRAGLDPENVEALLKVVNESKGCAAVEHRLALAYNIFHTGENYDLQIDNLEELCNNVELRNCVKATENCRHITTANVTFDRFLREILAMTYLRLGEEENCRLGHTHESCLFPLQGTAVHKLPFGSNKAIELVKLQLQMDPSNLNAKWMLNVAYMTLGQYPDSVPREYLVDPHVFESDNPTFPVFPNVAGGLHLDEMSSMGNTIVDDFLGHDGLLDVFTCAAAYNYPVHLYQNIGDGTFKDVTDFSGGLVGIGGGANCKQGDFNNDGHLDVFIVRGGWVNLEHPNSLLQNLGNGSWVDVTYQLFPTVSHYASHSAAFFDYDRDGLLDILVANENSRCELWHNQGPGKQFVDVAAAVGVQNCGLVKGLDFADFDNDGWQDIYYSRYGTKNLLLRNIEGKKFVDVTVNAGVSDPTLSFPVGFFDFNQDGLEDIYVAGHLFEAGDAVLASYTGEPYFREGMIGKQWGLSQRESRLYINNGNGTFTDFAHTSKLSKVRMSMAINMGDIDQDGLLDIYHGTGQPDLRALQPNRLFRNANGTFFEDVTTASRTGSLQKGHGISISDLDNDGDLDIYTNIGGAFRGDYFRNSIFLNPGFANTDWIQINVRGGSGESFYAVGARVTITLKEANEAGRKTFYRTVGNGASYGANTLRVHSGLGKNGGKNIEEISIKWPRSGLTQTWTNVAVNGFIELTHGDAHVKYLTRLPRLHLDVAKLTEVKEHSEGCEHHADHSNEHVHDHHHHH